MVVQLVSIASGLLEEKTGEDLWGKVAAVRVSTDTMGLCSTASAKQILQGVCWAALVLVGQELTWLPCMLGVWCLMYWEVVYMQL